MKVSVERTAPDEAIVSVEVEPERVNQAVVDAYHRLAQRYAIPGFRRGHAPRTVVDTYVGKPSVEQEAMEHLLDATFYEAVDQERLRPIGSVELQDEVHLEEGQALAYRAKVRVKPDLEVAPHTDLTFDVEHTEVSDADVDAYIETMRREAGRLVPGDVVGPHCVVRAQVKTEVDGEVLEAERETVLDMEQGDPVVENLPETLDGSPVGETRQVVWTVPMDHPTHGGREATTSIEILEIRDRDLPEVDEAFAKRVGAESVEELRARVRRILELESQYAYQRARVQGAVDALCDATEVEVPEPLVERQSDILWEELLDNLRQNQVTLEAYLTATGQNEETVRAGFAEDAVKRAKRNLVLESLARKENLLPAEGEIWEAAQQLLGMGRKGAKGGKRNLTRSQREYLEDVVLRQHALDLLGRIYGPADSADLEGEGEDDAVVEGTSVKIDAASGAPDDTADPQV